MKLSFPCFLAAVFLAESTSAQLPADLRRLLREKQKPWDVERAKSGKGKKDTKACKEYSKLSFSTVYTMTNQPNNKILVYSRDENDGKLTFEDSVATNGTGGILSESSGPPAYIDLPPPIGDPLASTGSIIVASTCLLAVNAGSDNISTFRIKSSGEIELLDTVASGGDFPVSIAEKKGLVYALNAGGNGHIQGYSLTEFNCMLIPIGDPIKLRQGTVSPDPAFFLASPSQIGFTPEGNILVIIKTNGGGQNFPSGVGSLNVYEIDPIDGETSDAALDQVNMADNGTIPFSFDFDDVGSLLLVEAFGVGGAPNGTGEVNIFVNNILEEEVATGQDSSCWIKYNPKNSCVYTTNTGSDSISSISISLKNGAKLVEGVAAKLNAPVEMTISQDGRYLYVLSSGHTNGSGQPRIYVYEMKCDCGLKEVQAIADGLDSEETRNATDGTVNGVTGLALYPN